MGIGRAARLLAAMALIGITGPGRGELPLQPGLSAAWRIELLAEGRRSEERFRVFVAEEVEAGLWRLDIEHGEEGRHRVLYRAGGDLPAFDARRIAEMDAWRDGRWTPMDPAELTLLDRVREMELSLAGAESLGDTLYLLPDGQRLQCRRLRLDDEGEALQEGESVRLRTLWKVTGEVWISPKVPLGAWVLYREERVTKKYSEFGGQSFEGETQTSSTVWTLAELNLP